MNIGNILENHFLAPPPPSKIHLDSDSISKNTLLGQKVTEKEEEQHTLLKLEVIDIQYAIFSPLGGFIMKFLIVL